MTTKEFNHCVDRYGNRVYAFALKNTGNAEDARDIVQEAYEKMWRKVDSVQADKAKSYLFSTVYHCIIDHFRKIKRIDYREELADRPAQADDRLDDRQWIEAGLRKMSEQERSLILLRDYEGYSYEEITHLTGLSLSQVKVYLFRARKKFRDWMTELNKINQVI